MSGPQWLHDFRSARSLGAGGCWYARENHHRRHGDLILEACGYKLGFVIRRRSGQLRCFRRLGDSPFFVIEADEYDCAFFDKRSKFVHYRPRTLILNNLEFDHADIF